MIYMSTFCRPSISIELQMALRTYCYNYYGLSTDKSKAVQLGIETRSVSTEEEYLSFDFTAGTRQNRHLHFPQKNLSLL